MKSLEARLAAYEVKASYSIQILPTVSAILTAKSCLLDHKLWTSNWCKICWSDVGNSAIPANS